MEKEKNEKSTKISIHAIRNILGDPGQLSLFRDHDIDFCNKHKIRLDNKIERFGIDLTEYQSRVLEAILHGFTLSNYQGNHASQVKEEVVLEKFSGKQPKILDYVKELPVLRVKQKDIFKWSGVSENKIADRTRAVEALKTLGVKQYCFFYERVAQDSEGNLVKNKNGSWKKEQVHCVDTLFTIKEIRSDKYISYYEIIPSPIFLDQVSNYFLLIPYNWREEVRKLLGNRKASSYTFHFLMFLRYQYEMKRRSRRTSALTSIKWSPEEVAAAINVPKSVYLKHKKKMNQTLDTVYGAAKKLGYLESYKRTGYLDVLHLNKTKYYNPEKNKNATAEQKDKKFHSNVESVFQYFHDLRKGIDSGYRFPSGSTKYQQLLEIEGLLANRDVYEVKKVIEWSVNKKYWCTRISSPSKLKSHFTEAFMEMVSSRGNKEKNEELLRGFLNRCELVGIVVKYHLEKNQINQNVMIRLDVVIEKHGKIREYSEFVKTHLAEGAERFSAELERLLEVFVHMKNALSDEEKKERKAIEERKKHDDMIKKSKEAFFPIVEHLRGQGCQVEWGKNGDLKVNGKQGYIFANNENFLEDIKVYLRENGLCDKELGELIKGLQGKQCLN